MTKTPDQEAHITAMSTAGPIPRQAPNPTHTAEDTENTGEQDTVDHQTGDQDAGDIPPGPASGDPPPEPPARPREEPLKITVKRRLEAEGRWAGNIELERNQMMKLARKQGMSKEDAQLWVYGELDRMYPAKAAEAEQPSADSVRAQRPVDDGQIQGLSAIPDSWSELPANASLSAEIGWVQANRLRIVEEKPGHATVVRLDLALSPAPSWSALGWLETSIRSYAKYVDVAAKATASDDGEADVMRRERMAIEEVRGLLDDVREEMSGQ
ncbi:hypothetical protein CA54_52870 [Symmachiella macrocystis]|uniref:Uncharacterized protein n=1 Tax=Symmachiella macrocystis TaxID=2527985 RepID=A0A5C6B3L1_9PLAN|nr:hypothetical protein [Symmachiella macrocystis]TWU06885.1 hypothetical protein CA54_52870 [Symmachiella macrocystis]